MSYYSALVYSYVLLVYIYVQNFTSARACVNFIMLRRSVHRLPSSVARQEERMRLGDGRKVSGKDSPLEPEVGAMERSRRQVNGRFLADVSKS